MTASARTVTVATTSGGMPVYDARPADTPAGAVVVIQEAFGVNDHIEDVTRRFASAGYRAVAPHLFYRTGDPALSYDDLPAIWPHMQGLTEQGLVDDIDATLGYLEDDAGLAPARIGIVGFCMGGSVTVLAATRRHLGAAVSFYGGGVTEGRFGMPPLVELATGLQTPWLGLYGGQDQGIPVEAANALHAAAMQSGVPNDMVIYPDAGHGFHCDQRAASYDAAAATDAWSRTLAWFGESTSHKSLGPVMRWVAPPFDLQGATPELASWRSRRLTGLLDLRLRAAEGLLDERRRRRVGIRLRCAVPRLRRPERT